MPSLFIRGTEIEDNLHKKPDGIAICNKKERVKYITDSKHFKPPGEPHRAFSLTYFDSSLNAKVLIGGFYCSPKHPKFLTETLTFFKKSIERTSPAYIVISGDANTKIDDLADERSKNKIIDFITEADLIDCYWFRFPDINSAPTYTYFPPDHNKSPLRIDYVFISHTLVTKSSSCDLISKDVMELDHWVIKVCSAK